MANYRYSILLLLLSISSFSLSGSNHKFGKITKEELEITSCPIDSNAHAYYIFDNGDISFNYKDKIVRSDDASDYNSGFQMIFKRHCQIKIIDNEGLDYATFTIRLYQDAKEEKLTSLRAFTYNLVNGELQKQKFNLDDLYYENTSENWKTAKFTLSNVHPGSVIEVEYYIISDFFFNLQPWRFQHMIPTLESNFIVSIPEYFHYNKTTGGYFPIQYSEDKTMERLTLTYEEKSVGMSQGGTYTYNLEFWNNIYMFSANNIPGFPDEEYLNSPENYLSKVDFELNYYQFPNQRRYDFNTSWEKIKLNLMENERFYLMLDKTNHYDEFANQFSQAKIEDTLQLAGDILNYIKSKIVWNGENSLYPGEKLSKSFETGNGNAADVNMNLIALLRKMGFDAYPLVLSTKKNGIIHPAHPSVMSFNFVVAAIKNGDKLILLDATNPYSDINLIPINCLNDKGLLIAPGTIQWVDLMKLQNYSFVHYITGTLQNDLSFRGNFEGKYQGYGAFQLNTNYVPDDYIRNQQNIVNGFANQEVVINNLTKTSNTSHETALRFNFTIPDFAQSGGELVYFNPIYYPFFLKNPFQLDERKYPVEFNYPVKIQQIYRIEIPEGYLISELPKPLSIISEDKSIQIRINSVGQGNILSITWSYTSSRSIFLPEEYYILKEIFRLLVQKQEELVVLKANQ